MKKHIPYIILFSAVMTSCSNKEVPPREYVRYVESPSNGLKIQQEVNGVRYELQYQPINYCVMLEKRSFSIPSEIFEQEHKRFEGLEHYSFRIDKTAMDNLVGKLGDISKYKRALPNILISGYKRISNLWKGMIPYHVVFARSMRGLPIHTHLRWGSQIKIMSRKPTGRRPTDILFTKIKYFTQIKWHSVLKGKM